jgi:hypothetical protein
MTAPADTDDASLEEFLALNGRLIRRIANLRAAIETVRDGTAHDDLIRDFCEQVLATDNALWSLQPEGAQFWLTTRPVTH